MMAQQRHIAAVRGCETGDQTRQSGLPEPLGPTTPGDAGIKTDLYLIGKTFKALDLQFLEYLFTFPLSRPAA